MSFKSIIELFYSMRPSRYKPLSEIYLENVIDIHNVINKDIEMK